MKKKGELVKIEEYPPLHQSTVEVMACPVFYIETVIKGKKQPGGMDSARGNQVHRTMSVYHIHCGRRQVAMDLEAFDRFAAGAGPVAVRILVGVRDSYQVDFEHLLTAEMVMCLDEDLNPTHTHEAISGFCGDSRRVAHYRGTPDAIFLFRTDGSIIVKDFKTHPRPFDPDDTFQAKEYALFMFKHFPWANRVTFQLVFVRYKNLVREVTFTREHDLYKLSETVKFARARQLSLHVPEARDFEAIPGNHCQYCPMLTNRKCPIAEFNPQMQLTPQDRLRFAIWYSQFAKANKAALKAYVQETGRMVRIADFNGRGYVYGPREKESKQYPLFKSDGHGGIEKDHFGRPVMPIAELLVDHEHAYPDDAAWLPKVLISSTKLDSYLGAKSRAILDQAVSDSAIRVPKAPLEIMRPEETTEDDEAEWEKDEDEEDDNA